MTDVKTASGFEIAVDEDAIDDMELFEALISMDKGDISVMPTVIDALLGADGKKRLYEHLRGDNGKVKITDTLLMLQEIFSLMKSKKKSSDTPA